MSGPDDDDDKSDYDEDGDPNYENMEENHGHDYVVNEVAESGDPDGQAYLNETDRSLDNEDLGLDKDGDREDD